MRSNNLLMSLLANSSANPRSNSLMHKDNYTNPFSLGARSNSLSSVPVQNKKPKAFNAESNVSLVRMLHFLNLKVKNHYYFFFCKLESNLKNHKKVRKEEIKQVQDYQIPSEDNKEQDKSSNFLNNAHKTVDCKSKSLSILCDSFNTFKSKREILLQRQLLITGFMSITHRSNKIKSMSTFQLILKKHILKKQRIVFDNFAKIEKDRIRNQIFLMNLAQIITKQYAQTFKTIKSFSRQMEDIQILPVKTLLNDLKTDQPLQNCNYPLKIQQQSSSKHQNSEKTSRSKKIILRERKTNTAQPISFTSNNIKVVMTQDAPLSFPTEVKLQQKMGRLHNIKPDINLSCLPDLNDNCHLFRECEMPSLQIKTMTTIQNFYTEVECLTDRSIKNTQTQISKSLKNTPKYCKDKSSINLAIKKEVHLTNPQSPLAKIDEILNRIEQMKSYRSTQISCQKKSSNVNIEKKTQMQLSALKYRTKTPNKRHEQSQKQNLRERLITERQKPVKKIRGIESGSKYKSTVLTKSKDQKNEFTAKKMKMEIENIINKRNKQLYYRVESAQLT